MPNSLYVLCHTDQSCMLLVNYVLTKQRIGQDGDAAILPDDELVKGDSKMTEKVKDVKDANNK